MHPANLAGIIDRTIYGQRDHQSSTGYNGGFESSLSDRFLTKFGKDSADITAPVWDGSGTVFIISEEYKTNAGIWFCYMG